MKFPVFLFIVCSTLLNGAVLRAEEIPAKWAGLAQAVKTAGGTIQFSDGEPVAIDLYNGNNPLKKRGGRNKIVNDAWLDRLVGIGSLRTLSLANCDITNAGLKPVGTLTGLEELNLTLTPVTDAGFLHLGQLTQLRNLGLASTKCTGEGFKHLKGKNLERVNFHYTPLNNQGLEAICNVGVTERFWFAHVHFTDAGVKPLAKLKKLKILGIGSAEKESSGAAVAVLVDLPLVDLSLLDRQADKIGFLHATKIKTLQSLDVSYAPQLTDEELKQLKSLPALTEFRLGGATQVTDASLEHFAACKNLKKLTLSRLKNITTVGLAKLRQARPDLEVTVK